MTSVFMSAGEVVLWCVAAILGVAVVAIASLYAWDKYTAWKWEKNSKKKGGK
jgi:hypothetical protein